MSDFTLALVLALIALFLVGLSGLMVLQLVDAVR